MTFNLLKPREPANAWTHAAGVALAVAGTAWLWRRTRGQDPGKRASLMVYGGSMAACYAASTALHTARAPEPQLRRLERVDRAAIYVLIAGTYTPLAWTLLEGRWRRVTLGAIWGTAAAAATRVAVAGPLPRALSLGLYLAMGWGGLACYRRMARATSHRAMRPLLVGGALYSAGAAVKAAGWPDPWPGRFGSHAVFHLFVLAGSLAHYDLMLRAVVPHEPEADGPLMGAEGAGSLAIESA